MTTFRGSTAAVALVLAGAAAHHVLVQLHAPGRLPANDVYAYFLPNMLHAVHAVRHAGRGLLWNPFQTCGQPFLANGQMGLLYPPHWLFLVLEPNHAVHAVQILNLWIGAIGTLLLTRQLGATPIAAFAGALVFEFGTPMAELTGQSPMHSGPWTWVPWVMLFTERLLVAPDRAAAIGLPVVLGLQFLPGFPLIAILTAQLVVCRVAWELVTRRHQPPWRGAFAIAGALVAAPLLAGVQVLPMAELVRQSLRAGLPAANILDPGEFRIPQILAHVARRIPPVPVLLAPLVVAAFSPLRTSTRRLAAFYLMASVTFALLGLGNATPLFRWYAAVPLGAATLRFAVRFFWLSGFCLAPLTAFGVDALSDVVGGGRRGAAILGVAVLTALAFIVTPGGVRPTERVALLAVIGAVVTGAFAPTPRRFVRCILLGGLALNLATVSIAFPARWLESLEPLRTNAPLFAALDPPVGDQDRVFLMPDVGAALRLELMQKTSTVLRVPGLFDYEALYGRRFAEYFTTLRRGTGNASLMDVYLPFPWLTDGRSQRLLDAAAVRYLVVSASLDGVARPLGLPEVPVPTPDVRVYRNPAALPRARWVPRVEVVPDADELLHRLASGADDLAGVALVETEPPSGFTGMAGAARAGAATFTTNDPEHVVIDVEAPGRGFLVLADQYYPGWRATVNQQPAPILRANYLFRLVEVPAGRSRVEFRFRPATLAVGVMLSTLTAAAILVIARRVW